MSLTGKTALITGASKGIGAATALHLSSLGAKVVINYSSSAASAEALVAQIGADKAIAVKADVGNMADIARLVDESVRFGGGKLDILIANAAYGPTDMDLMSITESEWERVFNVNVKGVLFWCSSTILLLSTSLCNLSSITPNYLLYVSSKGAVEQMTRVLAKDLGRKGINVNCVAPGPTATELFFKGKSEQLVKTIAGWNPHNRLGRPEEVASAIAWLVGAGSGSGSSWVNGQVMRVNGGMTV